MKRILIADDHDVVRKGIIKILADEFGALQTGEAEDADELLRLAGKGKWHLTILDINMPGRSGLDVLADLKTLLPNVPVLVVSAYTEQEYAVRAFKLGAAGFMPKSNVGEEMPIAARRVIEGRKYVSPRMAPDLAEYICAQNPSRAHDTLSQREFEVMRMIAQGNDVHQMARLLSLSEKTIATYRGRIYDKLSVSNNVELTRYAIKHHLVE